MSDANAEFYQNIPDGVPRTYHPIFDPLFRWIFRIMGWSFEGDMPDIKKAIVILVPHTSNWDFFIACLAKFSLQLHASYVMKKEAFFWPFKNWLIRIGGIPIDRAHPVRTVSTVAKRIMEEEKIWVVITPEGTRKKVNKFKTGFIRIAHMAEVPVIVVGLDYHKKKIIFSKVVAATGDHDGDADALYQFCKTTFVGRRPEHQ